MSFRAYKRNLLYLGLFCVNLRTITNYNMLKISQRGIDMPSSPIRKLTPLANAAKERGVKVYHLNIGQPDLPTPQKALDALKSIDRNVLEYSPSQGFLSLREKLVI